MEKYEQIINKANLIISSFPKSKNGQNFIKLKNGRKLFFTIFIKKYGLNNKITKYSKADITRRLRLVEFFDYLVKQYDYKPNNMVNKNYFIIETNFYRFIILETKNNKLELLSFYHYL